MVDAISSRPAGPLPVADQLASSAAGSASAATAASAASKAPAASASASDVGGVTRMLASEPPVDADKVQEIRAAIRSGNYPIDPYTIAESMIRSLRG